MLRKMLLKKLKMELEKAQEANQNTQAQLIKRKKSTKKLVQKLPAEAKAEVSKAEAEECANQASLNNSQSQELPSEQAVQQQECCRTTDLQTLPRENIT